MTTKSTQRDGQTHYWLVSDQGTCQIKQPDAAVSAGFCLTSAGDMGWRTDPDTNKDYCPDHVAPAEYAPAMPQLPQHQFRSVL